MIARSSTENCRVVCRYRYLYSYSFVGTATGLTYAYDNSLWVLNDPTCMVAAVRLLYTGKGNTNLKRR